MRFRLLFLLFTDGSMNSSVFDAGISERFIADSVKKSYLDYSMSVIVSRAIPDVRDGLKPVHRRVLYIMHSNGMRKSTPYKKSARVVGDVIGKLHPHGDSAVYDTVVRMAQDFKMLHPLIDGQGNFGSIDGDNAAAMRYTEIRMERVAEQFFAHMGKKVVDYRPNYDGQEEEPVLLPVTFPNILINGADGIAVGIACSVPPHNLREVADAFTYYIDHRDQMSVADVARFIKGPDLPTGGIAHGIDGFHSALATGAGKMRVRCKHHVEDRRAGAKSLVIDEIPFQVNKKNLVEKIGELINDKKIEGVTDLRDESNKEGIRVVLDIRRDADPELVLNRLLSMTDLETTVSYNMMLLHNGQPNQMGFLDVFRHFLNFRLEVIDRKTRFEIAEVLARLHILDGFKKVFSSQDAVDRLIALIRASKSPDEARKAVMEGFDLDEIQAKAIVEKRLYALTSLEIEAVMEEHAKLTAERIRLEEFLASEPQQLAFIKGEIEEVKTREGVDRRTRIENSLSAVEMEDLIERQDVVIVYTKNGYIKYFPEKAISTQNRNTRGKSWMQTDADDFVVGLHHASTHDYLLAFTERGQLIGEKVYRLPESNGNSKGRHIRNIFDGIDDGKIVKLLSIPAFADDAFLVTISERGNLKRTALSEYSGALRKGGVLGVKLEDGDRIVAADICRDFDTLLIFASNGKGIRMIVDGANMRPMGRNAAGSTGMRFDEDERVIGMVVVPGNGEPIATRMASMPVLDEEGNETGEMRQIERYDTSAMDEGLYVLMVGEQGAGKRMAVSELQPQRRGGKGVMCYFATKKGGKMAKVELVDDANDVVLMTEKGVSNRIRCGDVSPTSRTAHGMRFLMNLDDGDRIIDCVAVAKSADESDEAGDAGLGVAGEQSAASEKEKPEQEKLQKDLF